MMNRKYMLGLTAAAPFAALPARASSQDLEALYEGAKREGALSLYTGGVAANSASTVAAFNKVYPGITVTVNGDYSNVTDLKIDKQLAQKRVDCDIASLQTVQDFVRWNRAGEIAPFKFDGWAGIPAEFKDPGGAFVATNINPLTYGYNPKLVKEADIPRSALDFLKPQFRGQAITCYPHDDDATLFLFYTLERKYGTEFIQRYMAMQPEWVEGHLGVCKAIASGKKLVTFDCSAHTALDMKDAGQAIDVRFSPVDETPIFYNTMGIMRRAPHPNAARLFISWYLAPAQQIATRNWSARPDVPPPQGQKPLSSYALATRYKEFLVNTSLVATERSRYLAYTGPVVNRS
jgi:ABC-type Fe3+ transport system substrate-binding protein